MAGVIYGVKMITEDNVAEEITKILEDQNKETK